MAQRGFGVAVAATLTEAVEGCGASDFSTAAAPGVQVDRAKLVEVLRFLRDNPGHLYEALIDITVVDHVATEISEDQGTKDTGGDLGFIERGQMVEAFEEAAFALEEGETSPELVRSTFGFHVIRVEERRTAVHQPFEAVREELARELGEAAIRPARLLEEEESGEPESGET